MSSTVFEVSPHMKRRMIIEKHQSAFLEYNLCIGIIFIDFIFNRIKKTLNPVRKFNTMTDNRVIEFTDISKNE
ncbi:hypothetical protein PSCICL_11570 [Pseudomonas cichorii]|nr:hypothetical protein PSCICG_25340 [Pseudomonas cichorii]GFM70165.1 hypothetical protein PSCICL_11570 [Pseudomonas cichorii]